MPYNIYDDCYDEDCESEINDILKQLKSALLKKSNKLEPNKILVYGFKHKNDESWRSRVMPVEVFEKINRRERNNQKIKSKEKKLKDLQMEIASLTQELKPQDEKQYVEMDDYKQFDDIQSLEDVTKKLQLQLDQLIESQERERSDLKVRHIDEVLKLRNLYLDTTETIATTIDEVINLREVIEIIGDTKAVVDTVDRQVGTDLSFLQSSEVSTQTEIEVDSKQVKSVSIGVQVNTWENPKELMGKVEFEGDPEVVKWKKKLSEVSKGLIKIRVDVKAILVKHKVIDANGEVSNKIPTHSMISLVKEIRQLLNI